MEESFSKDGEQAIRFKCVEFVMVADNGQRTTYTENYMLGAIVSFLGQIETIVMGSQEQQLRAYKILTRHLMERIGIVEVAESFSKAYGLMSKNNDKFSFMSKTRQGD